MAGRVRAQVERARAEDALGRSEARHRSPFRPLDAGVCPFERLPTRPDNRYVAMNPAMPRMSAIPDLSGGRSA